MRLGQSVPDHAAGNKLGYLAPGGGDGREEGHTQKNMKSTIFSQFC